MVTWSVPLTVLPDTYNGQALWYVAFIEEYRAARKKTKAGK